MRRLLPVLLVAASLLAGCSAEEGTPPVVDDPDGRLTVVAPPVMRDAIEDLDAAWTAEGNDPLRVDLGPATINEADQLQTALTAAAPTQVPSDVVLTDNPSTLDSAEPSLWTDAGLVVTTELRAVLPAGAADEDAGRTGTDVLSGARVAVCGDHCGELAQEWLAAMGGDSDATLLPVPDEVADGRRQIVAEDYADVPPWSGRLAALAVLDGEADLALTYLADVADDDVITVFLPDAPAVGLTALVSEGRDTAEATAFVGFLQGAAGRQVLEEHGFTAP